MSYRLRVKDSQGEREVLLVTTIAVGRDPRCEISAADPQLSRRHAEFSVSNGVVVVRDLNSRNGLMVNGRRSLEAELGPGDVVQLAGLAVTFLAAVAAPDAPSTESPESSDGEKTGMMTAEEAAAAAAASAARIEASGRPSQKDRLPPPADQAGPRPPAWAAAPTAEGPSPFAVATGGLGPAASPPIGSRSVEPPPVPQVVTPPTRGGAGLRTAEPGSSDAVVMIASSSLAADGVQGGPAAPVPAAQPNAAATPALNASPDARPASGVVTKGRGVSFAAGILVQVVLLAALSFAFGTVTSLAWRSPAGSEFSLGIVPLLMSVIGLAASLVFGLFIGARFCRSTEDAMAAVAFEIRKAASGEAGRVTDPLGTKSSGELVGAINEIVSRARRS